MKFKLGDLIERVAWGTVGPNVQKSFRSNGAKGIIVQLPESGSAVKVSWFDSQVTKIEWACDLGKISTAPPEKSASKLKNRP